MYIEIHNWKELQQKSLYFKLNNAFNMQIDNDTNQKLAGIYAIYKNDICLYIGQSKNIASRLATHLKGKYELATDIYIWDIKKIGFSNFENKTDENKKGILDNCEKHLMTIFKPIENLLIDMNFTLEDKFLPDIYDFQLTEIVNDKEITIGYFSNNTIKISEELVIFDDFCDTYKLKKIGDMASDILFMPKEYIIENAIDELHGNILKIENIYYDLARVGL